MTKDFKLVYNGNSCIRDDIGYSDSDWARDLRDYCSVSGFTFLMAGAAISWSLKKQLLIALSSTEGKYMVSEIPLSRPIPTHSDHPT